MAGLNIRYQPKRPGMGGVNDLPRSFAGATPFGDANAPKVGYQAPGATMNPAPKPRPPVGPSPFPGEPTDPRYVGPPQPNPVGDGAPKPTTGNVRVSYNPSAPTNPTLGQGNGIVGNPLTGTPAPGPFQPLPEPTLPGMPAPNPNADVNAIRQNETPQQRIDRLRALPNNNPNRTLRIQALRQRVQDEPFPGETPGAPVGGTQKLGNLAELAPPIGYNTFFRDVGKSDALQARKKKIKANAGVMDNTKKKAGGNEAPAEGDVTPGAGKSKGKLTDKQKKRLKRRPQPGTPQRPYQNRGVTYNPLAYGGKLRV